MMMLQYLAFVSAMGVVLFADSKVESANTVSGLLSKVVDPLHGSQEADGKQTQTQTQRLTQDDEIDKQTCEMLQGTYTDGECKVCPIETPNRDCCVLNLQDFSSVCDRCFVVDGQEVCGNGNVHCVNDVVTQSINCKGCWSNDVFATSRAADIDGRELCVDFACPAQGWCTCNVATLGGQSCHTCDIDGRNKPTLECTRTSASIGQPRFSRSVVMAGATILSLAFATLAYP